MINLIILPMDITKNNTFTATVDITNSIITAPGSLSDPPNIDITGITHFPRNTEDETNTIGGQTLIVIILDNLIAIISGVSRENHILDTDTKGDN